MTPPNLDYLEKAFSKLNSSASNVTPSPATSAYQAKHSVVNSNISNSQIFSTHISTSSAHNSNKLQTNNKTNSIPSSAGIGGKLAFLPVTTSTSTSSSSATSGSNMRSQKSMPLPIASSSLFCFHNNTN